MYPISSGTLRSEMLASLSRGNQSEQKRLSCDVEYSFYFCNDTSGSLSWAVVVGNDVHHHTWPMANVPIDAVKKVTKEAMTSIRKTKTRMITSDIESQFGCRVSLTSFEKIRYRMDREI